MIEIEGNPLTHGNGCRNCHTDKDLIMVHFSTGLMHLCTDCARQLAEGLNTFFDFVEPNKPHSGEWFTIWEQDKKNILSAMHRNLAADLDAGYNYTGQSIQKQLADIDEYKHEFDEQLMSFVGKSNKEIEDWCYWDLKRRGAIL